MMKVKRLYTRDGFSSLLFLISHLPPSYGMVLLRYYYCTIYRSFHRVCVLLLPPLLASLVLSNVLSTDPHTHTKPMEKRSAAV